MITGSLGPVLLEAEAAVEPLHEGQHVRVCVCVCVLPLATHQSALSSRPRVLPTAQAAASPC